VLLVLGVGLLVVARRGRRAGDHPVCRRCGFDLFGLPTDSQRCSECGADLTRRRAVLAGTQGRRWLPLAGGAVLLLLSGPPLVVIGRTFLRPVDVTPYRPAAALIQDIDGADPAARMTALVELTRRVPAGGGLSDRQLSGLIDRALAHQANRRARVWSAKWGELVEAAQDAGRLDGLRWSQYLSEAVTFELALRPRVRRGDPIPFWVTRKDVRVGRPYRFAVAYGGPSPLALSGVPVGSDPGPTGMPTQSGENVMMDYLPPGVVRLDPGALAGLADGWHTSTADLNVTVTDLTSGQTYTYRARATWGLALLPADQPSVTVNSDPALADVVQRALQVTVLFDGTQVIVWVKKVADPKEVLALSVAVRAGGREWPVGSMEVMPGPADKQDMTGGFPVSAAVPGFDAPSVDVILRSGPAAAVETMHITNVWEGEVVLENVPVVGVGPRATTQPAVPPPAGTPR
jgi:hypothetical protein